MGNNTGDPITDAILKRLGETLADADAMDMSDDALLSWDADEQPNLAIGDLRTLHRAMQSAAQPDGDVGPPMRFELMTAEFRVALRRMTEHYPPDTVAGRLAADVLAKYPNPYENADRENDCEPFEVEEIKGLPLGPQPNREVAAMQYWQRPFGDAGDAVDFACDRCGPEEALAFLEDWRSDRAGEWPGYMAWLKVQQEGSRYAALSPKEPNNGN